ncbi:serine/threonine-protein kinase [Streptosporangium sp. NPDC000396]|uniref:serine/threonine-protein kinase n=1 Tax=Streptosporangium sp. NPDC000396 TaxID=3366185 RepID=UPI003697A283
MAQGTRPGKLIGGRYRLVSELGSGGFGRVWKAHDETLSIDVAAKELWLPPVMAEAEQAERLARAAREARNAARLRDHPNIVGVHDVVVENGLPWIVMQLIDGCSLQEQLDAHGPLSVEETANVAAKLLRALGAAHDAEIVHRDVKPANIMISKSGEVLLADFGIAFHHADTALTVTGAVVGSMEYMAPERARGTDGLAASDLFSLGVTLYQAVEGVSPFRRDTPTGCLTAVLFEEAAPPVRAGRLAPLITGLLDKDPDRRPAIREALALIDASKAPTVKAPVEAPKAPTVRAPTVKATRIDRLGPVSDTKAAEPKRPKSGAFPLVAGGVLILAMIGVLVKWPFGGTGPFGETETAKAAAVCDEALQTIEAFYQDHPSFDEETFEKDPAMRSAGSRLARKLRAVADKTTEVNVAVPIRNYALTVENHIGDSARELYYGHVVSACEKVDGAPPE